MTNDPLAALLPVLADTMKFATQALAQSTALAELLVAKGVVTQAELDGRMALGQKLRDDLMAKLDEEIQKQSCDYGLHCLRSPFCGSSEGP
jgi:hypothetical protein